MPEEKSDRESDAGTAGKRPSSADNGQTRGEGHPTKLHSPLLPLLWLLFPFLAMLTYGLLTRH